MSLPPEEDEKIEKIEIPSYFLHLKIHKVNIKLKEENKFVKKLKWFFSLAPFSAIEQRVTRKFARKIETVASEYDVLHLSTLGLGRIIKYLPRNIRK